jgi:outer membrane protein OmpU
MKKILLGTSAIVALTALSTEAFAADKIALGLGGFHKQYANYSNHDDTPSDAMRLGQHANSEIYVTGKTTLDNGIDVAVRTEFEANGEDSGNSTDASFLTIGSDAMGTVRLGVAAHMVDDYAVRAPMVGPADWADIADYVAFNGTADANNSAQDLADFGDNTIKMGYHTPTFSGFTGYASYGVAEGAGANNGRALSRSGTDDSGSMGVAYEGEFSGASIAADVGYMFTNGAADKTRGGLNVGMAGFTVGGSYTSTDSETVATSNTADASGDAWELGVGYETGPYSVAAAYMNSDAKGTTAAGSDDWTAWTVGAGYDLGAGVGLVVQYVNSEYDNEGVAANGTSSASSIVAGVEVGF